MSSKKGRGGSLGREGTEGERGAAAAAGDQPIMDVWPLQQLEELLRFVSAVRRLSPSYSLPASNRHTAAVTSIGRTGVTSGRGGGYATGMSGSNAEASIGARGGILDVRRPVQDPQDHSPTLSPSLTPSHHHGGCVCAADDVFAAGCILAEMSLTRPFLTPSSALSLCNMGTLPKEFHQLPAFLQPAVKAMVEPNPHR